MLSAGRSSDMTAGRELQIRLSYLNSLRLNPAFPTARWRDQLAEVAKLSIEEGHFLEESRTSIVARASKAPTDPEQFIQWFEELKESGPGQQDPLFPWKLVATKDKLNVLLPTITSEERQRSKEILQALDEKAIAEVAPRLSGDQLLLLSNAQFKFKTFPWQAFAQAADTIRVLFATNTQEQRKKTASILKLLDENVIEILKDVLTTTHLRLYHLSEITFNFKNENSR